MCKVYGYARISRREQSIDRQIRNIKAAYPDAIIFSEAFTGTKLEGRKEFEKLITKVGKGDTIVFDSVSRMSRNADEGIELYFKLYNRDVDLVFLKEPAINTATYKEAMSKQATPQINLEDNDESELIGDVLQAVIRYQRRLAKRQIRLAFEQAQKEVDDLHQRTKEGIETARINGKQIGQQPGRKLTVKKASPAKEIIRRHCKDFGGTLTDGECIKLANVARNTYYKYKREIKAEAEEQ